MNYGVGAPYRSMQLNQSRRARSISNNSGSSNNSLRKQASGNNRAVVESLSKPKGPMLKPPTGNSSSFLSKMLAKQRSDSDANSVLSNASSTTAPPPPVVSTMSPQHASGMMFSLDSANNANYAPPLKPSEVAFQAANSAFMAAKMQLAQQGPPAVPAPLAWNPVSVSAKTSGPMVTSPMGKDDANRKGTWTLEEDQLLKTLVQQYGDDVSWQSISQFIPGRSAKQCRERYVYSLSPEISSHDWTPQEDAIIIQRQKEFGNKWAFISRELPGRTENSVKTRFKSLVRAKKREWTPQEDQIILEMHAQIGSKFDVIATKLPKKRSKNAVRNRFKQLKEANGRPISSAFGEYKSRKKRPVISPTPSSSTSIAQKFISGAQKIASNSPKIFKKRRSLVTAFTGMTINKESDAKMQNTDTIQEKPSDENVLANPNSANLPNYLTHYLGVAYVNQFNKWGASVYLESNKSIQFIGLYDSAEEAAKAHDAESKKLNGEEAKLNFP